MVGTQTVAHTYKFTDLHGLDGLEFVVQLRRQAADGGAHECCMVAQLFLDGSLHLLGALQGDVIVIYNY